MIKTSKKLKLAPLTVKLGLTSILAAGAITGMVLSKQTENNAKKELNELYETETFKEYVLSKNEEYSNKLEIGEITHEEYNEMLNSNYEGLYKDYITSFGTDEEIDNFNKLQSQKLVSPVYFIFSLLCTIVFAGLGPCLAIVTTQHKSEDITLIGDQEDDAAI